jgi:pimeloyl-ACP methyl ester carboxylesterase
MAHDVTAVLVHGAFADSSSWDGVVRLLSDANVDCVSFANPLRSSRTDGELLVDLLRSLDGRIVLVGHSYGGMVITEAAAVAESVAALVYVGGFVPLPGESPAELAGRFPGSTFGETLLPTSLADGGVEFRIDPARFHHQFAEDVPSAEAHLMAVKQRPVTSVGLEGPLVARRAAWQELPSWSVYGDGDRNIPGEVHRFQAERAHFVGVDEVAGASHAVAVSRPDRVAAAVLAAVNAVQG